MKSIEFGNSWPLHDYQHFELVKLEKPRFLTKSGGVLDIKGTVKNNDLELSTCYIIIKLADPYDHRNEYFNSDINLGENIKSTLRIVDVKPKGKKDFNLSIPIPESIENGVLDLQIEIWSPGRLYHKTAPKYTIALFDRTPYQSIVEIINNKENAIASVFISYSWVSEKHKDWIYALYMELIRHNIVVVFDQKDLIPGQQITSFIEKVHKTPICILVCSEEYTIKADNREEYRSGVASEFDLITNAMLTGRKATSIIPIIRDNPAKKLPVFMGSKMYINMDVKDWKGAPLNTLIRAIIAEAKKS